MKVKALFAWYDLWVGFFWDSKGRKLYFLPVPCFGIVIEFESKWNCDTCGVQLPKDPFKCVVFTSHLGTKFTEADVTGVRCYPCDDKITDAMLEESKQ